MVRPSALTLALLLTTVTALAGCLGGDEEPEEDPPVMEAPPPPANLTHNVTAYTGQITAQARGPVLGGIVSSSSNNIPNPITTTINYTGLVVKAEWSSQSPATDSLKLTCRPDSDNTDPIVVAGASPLIVPIDMSGPAPRTWFIEVTVDDATNPAAGGANQPYTVTIGQYAGHNGTFDPNWDPSA